MLTDPRRNPRMMGRAITYPFLDVRPSVPGRCYVLQDENILPIEAPVPDWWWIDKDRNIAINVGLPRLAILWTVFTCVADEAGFLFETAYIVGERVIIVARSKTVQEAKAVHAHWLEIVQHPESGGVSSVPAL